MTCLLFGYVQRVSNWTEGSLLEGWTQELGTHALWRKLIQNYYHHHHHIFDSSKSVSYTQIFHVWRMDAWNSVLREISEISTQTKMNLYILRLCKNKCKHICLQGTSKSSGPRNPLFFFLRKALHLTTHALRDMKRLLSETLTTSFIASQWG